MLKRSGHAVQTSVLTGQRAAARAGVQRGCSAVRLRSYLSSGTRTRNAKLSKHILGRVSMSSTRHIYRADDCRREPRP